MLVLFKEGLAKVKAQLAAMRSADTLLISKELLPVETRARWRWTFPKRALGQ
jgi:hypothetical protein